MMGGGNRLKHIEHFVEINILSDAAKCWLHFGNILTVRLPNSPSKAPCRMCPIHYSRKVYSEWSVTVRIVASHRGHDATATTRVVSTDDLPLAWYR
jgi:hypothetical protein